MSAGAPAPASQTGETSAAAVRATPPRADEDPRGEAPPPAPPRWLGFGLGALTLMLIGGLLVVSWWSRRNGPPPPVLGELPGFTLQTQDGRLVTRADLVGHPSVVDLVFTRCEIFCPRLTERLRDLGPRLPEGARRISISVDPAFDTPAVLTAYAREHRAVAPGWWFLTGPEADVKRLVIEGLKLGVVVTPAEDPHARQEAITHSTKLVLLDGQGGIRGYYDAFDEDSVSLLVRDAARLARAEGGR